MAISWLARTRYLLGVELLNWQGRILPHILSRDYSWVEASVLETLSKFNRQASDYSYTPTEVEQIRSDLNAIRENAHSQSGEALLSAANKLYKDVFDATNRAFAKSQEQYEAGIIKWGNERAAAEVISPAVEGPGEQIPPEYRYLIGWLREPLPELTLAEPVEVTERKIDAVLKQLKDSVETIQQSERFHLFLVTMSKFHEYSIGNQILIMIQKPGATHVAGFATWKDLGRWVKAGEKGIAILAPTFPGRELKCPICQNGGVFTEASLRKHLEDFHQRADIKELIELAKREAEAGVTPTYFKVVYVFDISQTEGKPLPEFEVPVLTGEVNEELFSKAMALAKAQGLTVSFESRPQQDPAIKGEYFGKSIWIRPEESRAQQLKSLLHEVAHYYSEGVFRIPRVDAETIAESAAFVIGAHNGFDTGVRSFPYVALWAKDKKVLEQNLAAIRRVATTIMDALEGESARVETLAAIEEKARRCARCGRYSNVKYRSGIGLWLCDDCFKLWSPGMSKNHE